MSKAYKTRKKKLSHNQRRNLTDAQDAISPLIIKTQHRNEAKATRFQIKLDKFNEENRKADEAIRAANVEIASESTQVKRKLAKKPTTDKAVAKKKITTKKATRKKVAKKDNTKSS